MGVGLFSHKLVWLGHSSSDRLPCCAADRWIVTDECSAQRSQYTGVDLSNTWIAFLVLVKYGFFEREPRSARLSLKNPYLIQARSAIEEMRT